MVGSFGPGLFILHGVFEAHACEELIKVADKALWHRSSASQVDGPTRWTQRARLNTGVLDAAVSLVIPVSVTGWRFLRVATERAIVIRYDQSDFFPPHTDSSYEPTFSQKSFYTLLVYLNDNFEGGETRFSEIDRVVRPERGSALVIPHGVVHEGLPVKGGTKYALHTFVLYGRDEA